jgi:hypothetical protein
VPAVQIATFEDLVQAARRQPVPQRLLFVFAKAVLPKGADEDEQRRFQAKSGGGLQPLMSVDKRPEDLGSFAALAAEADAMSADWQIVFVAALAGRGAVAPTADDTDRNLQLMIDTIQAGGDVTRYLAFDRGGDLLAISPD